MLGAYVGAGVGGIEGVFYDDGYVLAKGGLYGGWVYYFSSEVRHFHSFGVGHVLYGEGFFYFSGVGGHYAVHVGPYFYDAGMNGSSYNSGGIVGASSAEGGCLSFGGSTYEACDDEYVVWVFGE